MKKLLTLFFLAFIGILLVGCGDEKINIGKTEPFDYGGYSIIRADNAAEYEIKAAISLRSRLEEAGISLALTTDWVKRGEPVPESGKEILIGVTNRSESLTSFEGLKAKDYIIRKNGERVVIAGGSEAALNAAIETFAGQCVDVKSASIKLPAGDGFKYSFKYQISALKLEGVDIGEYTLVTGNSEASVKCANIIRSRIENLTGLILPVITDQTEPREHEIIVGTNSRADSQMLEVPAGGSVIAKSSNGIVLRGSDADDDYYAVAFFILNYLGSDLKGEVNFTMKSETTFVNADMPVMDAIELYVAPGGSDDNDGSLKKPFATIERARDEVRRLKEDSLAAINVNLRGGEYKLGKTVEFTSGDSGLPFSPIVYRAYKDEQAVILGGVRIPAAEAVKVADAAITGRVIDSFAASKLMMIDLKDYVDTIPGLLSGTDTLTSGAVEIYI